MARSPFANVLASAIGSSADPVVTLHDIQPGDVTMLCTDGLTKHVSLERIQQRLSDIPSAEEGCRALVDDALQDGGTDNVTVLIARTKVKTPAPSAA
jgi:protein phosphatase